MRLIFILLSISLTTMLLGQGNVEFRAALASEVQKLGDGESIVVEYKKTGCWGDYEGGYIKFTQKESDIEVVLTNTNQHFEESEESKTWLTKKELLDRLNNLIEDRTTDPEKTVFSNYIRYNITKDGVSLALINATIEPDQVTNKVGLVPRFQDFLNQGKSKKPGIIINNVSGM